MIPWSPRRPWPFPAPKRYKNDPASQAPPRHRTGRPLPLMNVLAKNLLILASAGSGKTYQLGNRVIGLVAGGIPPERIVALTFTRKAAGEFADAVLTKLARAAADPAVAIALRAELGQPDADFQLALEQVVRVLPRLVLGTMDGFFSKIVRSFQYELGVTGGRFELLEGPQLEAARDGLLDAILGQRLARGDDEGFFHAFRRAMVGREELKVADGLRDFVKQWQGVYRERAGAAWGPPELAGVELMAWETRKHGLLERVRQATGGIDFTDKRQAAAFENLLDTLANHTTGSGSLGSPAGLLASLFGAVAASRGGPLDLKFHKPFTVPGQAAAVLRECVELLARCELAAALVRTRAVREVMAVYDALCDQRLRRRGWLGFDDVKFLMGEWARDEQARLRREAVDFRLDSRHEHWLLDEFQDTSRADWLGLQPLIDEAAAEGPGSVFVVGDRKQAIYAWRGGEVGLFDEVLRRYGGGMETAEMVESWRSCPQVLALVNRVCGDTATLRRLFGEAADRWQWQDHVAAAPLQTPGKRGEARVEMIAGDWPDRLTRTAGLLRELEVGRRVLSCGVLVRSNSQVRDAADALREAGFDVIEEGRREPARDHPVGVAIARLVTWLADPAHAFAREVVAMSPLAGPVTDRGRGSWDAAWADLTATAAVRGMAATLAEVVAPVAAGWSEFGRRRAADLLGSLAEMDAQGGVTWREAADRLTRLEVSQSPGVAAVQVMTIHKAKGLGFDVVVLPEVPGDAIPQAQYFHLAATDTWLTQPPPRWARDLLPEMREAEDRWAADQRYEAMCLFYVALTRAKRGLYVLLEEPAKSRDADKPSLANWLEQALDASPEPGVIHQEGTADWIRNVPLIEPPAVAASPPPLGPASPRRPRLRPSATPGPAHSGPAPATPGSGGIRFGSAVHAAFERVGWIDEELPSLPPDDAGRLVAGLLEVPELRALFTRAEAKVELFREQPLEALLDGHWLSGVVDRLHLHRDDSGRITRLEVVDFKTDAVGEPAELLDRHRAQMAAYRAALTLAYPGADIRCRLLSTHLRAILEAC